MEARIVNIKANKEAYEERLREFELIREESLRNEAQKRREEQIDNLIKKIPLRFRSKSFDNYIANTDDQMRIKNIAIRFVESFTQRALDGSNLIFKGKPGTGKTLLSLLIYLGVAKKGFDVRYESSLDFIRELIDAKFKSEASYKSLIHVLDNADLLILDEVTESISKYGAPGELEKQVLFQIINNRYEKKKCTLVITNRSREEMLSRLGEPIVDRLSENGVMLAFNWESYRNKQGE